MSKRRFIEENHLPKPAPKRDLNEWKEEVVEHLAALGPDALSVVLPALGAYQGDGWLLKMAALAALIDNEPEKSLTFLQRFKKKFIVRNNEDKVITIVAYAQQKRWTQAQEIINKLGRMTAFHSASNLALSWEMMNWLHRWIGKVEQQTKLKAKAAKLKTKPQKQVKAQTKQKVETAPIEIKTEEVAAPLPPLPRYDVPIPISLSLSESLKNFSPDVYTEDNDIDVFRLRYEYTQLGLLQGFDELLCLPTLHNIETFWYQVEAARKVLKQFRGRVLLADEVGLGKTIEAGMILKEYILRGMVSRVLILTPATLVGQWQEEMFTKFDIEFATSYDTLVRGDSKKFWSQPFVIASIATARRAEHQEILSQQNYDMVIVDEAHHLKNRTTANWKLVNALQKRFLLMLSATPVQNSLLELYNLLTLLKPGIFKTEKDFRSNYMTAGKPRVPANRDRMRDLMRDVMIRNTRSLVDVHLPPRHAVTMKLEPQTEEADCYNELSRLVQEDYKTAATHKRLAVRHLLSAAGSTSTTAAGSIRRYIEKNKSKKEWLQLALRYENIALSAKEKSLFEVLHKNPEEKKMVFVHHRETLSRISDLLQKETMPFTVFEGSMTGPEKDRAVDKFRNEVPLLICTESGGEGRNLQFCNTMINFDLPWNPMAIEQRIGRIHRIGQTRDVFIFNLVTNGTLEEHILKILDEKINMFELVVGEIDSILGEMDEEQDFAELVFNAWVETTEHDRAKAFEDLGERLVEAKSQYNQVKALDEKLFGEDFVAG